MLVQVQLVTLINFLTTKYNFSTRFLLPIRNGFSIFSLLYIKFRKNFFNNTLFLLLILLRPWAQYTKINVLNCYMPIFDCWLGFKAHQIKTSFIVLHLFSKPKNQRLFVNCNIFTQTNKHPNVTSVFYSAGALLSLLLLRLTNLKKNSYGYIKARRRGLKILFLYSFVIDRYLRKHFYSIDDHQARFNSTVNPVQFFIFKLKGLTKTLSKLYCLVIKRLISRLPVILLSINYFTCILLPLNFTITNHLKRYKSLKRRRRKLLLLLEAKI